MEWVIALILMMLLPIGLIFWWNHIGTPSVFGERKVRGYTTTNSWILIPPFERHGDFRE
jgi:hypothetical protein